MKIKRQNRFKNDTKIHINDEKFEYITDANKLKCFYFSTNQ